MATSMDVPKLEVSQQLDRMSEWQEKCGEILSSFREFRYLCKKSGLFTEDTIMQVDKCAVDFRQLCFEIVTVTKQVSDVWLETAINLSESIDKFAKPKEILIVLTDKARDLAKCFKIVATWAKDLAGRLHLAVKEAERFKKVFKDAAARSMTTKDKAEKDYCLAKEDYQKTQHQEHSWIPSGLPSIQSLTSHFRAYPWANVEDKGEEQLYKTEKRLCEAREQLYRKEHELQKKCSESKKAEVSFHLPQRFYEATHINEKH